MAETTLKMVRTYLRDLPIMKEKGLEPGALQRFIQQGDPDAFAWMVHRYGPMVLGICRRIVGSSPDAEDAFQATFLCLAQKAQNIQELGSLPAWLHRVASRTASRLRQGPVLPTTEIPIELDHSDAIAEREILEILDEELDRLPKRLRGPLILCYLEGSTREEAAKSLGISLSTLKRQIQQGKELLLARMKNRGITSIAALTTVLSAEWLQARVSPELTRKTVDTIQGLSHQGSASVLLAQSGLQSGSHTCWKMTMVLLLAFTGLATGWALLAAEPAKSPLEVNQPAIIPADNGKDPRTDPQGDPLPPGAIHRFGTLRYRHGGGHNNAALSPNGKLLVTASEQGVTLFDVETGKPLHRLRESQVPNGFSATRELVAFATDNQSFLSIASSGTVRQWSVETGKQIKRFGDPGHPRRGFIPQGQPGIAHVRAATVHCNGSSIILSDHVGQVETYDLKSGKKLSQFSLSGKLLQIAQDGKTIVSFGKERDQIAIHNGKGKLLRAIGCKWKVLATAISPDGKLIATAQTDGQIPVWSAETGKQLYKLRAEAPKHSGAEFLTVLGISRDGKKLFAGTKEGLLYGWDLTTRKALPTIKAHYRYVTGIHFHSNGSTMVTVSWDGLIRKWDLNTGKPLPLTPGYVGHVCSALSGNRKWAAVADAKGQLDLYSSTTGKRIHQLQPNGPGINQMAFSPDSQILATGQKDNRIVFWSTSTWKKVRSLRLPKKPAPDRGSWFSAIVFAPDGRRLLSSCSHDGTRLWHVATGKSIWNQSLKGKAAFTPDGKFLATGGWNKSLTIRNAGTGEAICSVAADDIIDTIQFSPDGRALVTGHHDGTIRIRDPKTGQELRKIKGSPEVIWELSFTPDSQWLLAACSDTKVRLFEMATGQPVLELTGHDGRVYHGQTGPDGLTAITSAWDMNALLWSLRPAKVPDLEKNEEAIWEQLHSQDAAEAYRAIWALIDSPQAPALLQRKLKPIRSEHDQKAVLAMIKNLDARGFQAREKAMKALAALGPSILSQLKESLKNASSAEQKRRLQELIAKAKQEPGPDIWRIARAIQAMEHNRSAKAESLLRAWSHGAKGALLTRQAKAALSRRQKQTR